MKISDNGAPIESGRGLQQVKERIAREFERARQVERRRPGRSASTDTTFYRRRKDDKPLVVDAVVERFKQMIADAKDPEVELVELEPLEQKAAVLLAAIGGSEILHKTTPVHEINEIFEGDIQKLFDAAEIALGFRESGTDSLKCNKAASQPSIWKRNIFGRTR